MRFVYLKNIFVEAENEAAFFDPLNGLNLCPLVLKLNRVLKNSGFFHFSQNFLTEFDQKRLITLQSILTETFLDN